MIKDHNVRERKKGRKEKKLMRDKKKPQMAYESWPLKGLHNIEHTKNWWRIIKTHKLKIEKKKTNKTIVRTTKLKW